MAAAMPSLIIQQTASITVSQASLIIFFSTVLKLLSTNSGVLVPLEFEGYDGSLFVNGPIPTRILMNSLLPIF